MHKLLRLFVVLYLASFAAEASAADRYFVMIFGSESSPKRARFTHTWATVVKATAEPGDKEAYSLESQTISWMPASLKIRPLALRPECGVNLGLQATLRDSACKGECIAMWGPYELTPERGPIIWERVGIQVARLNSGCVLYKCVDPDTGPRSTYMSNCIHAVSDLDRHLPRPAYNELVNNGMDASAHLVQIMVSRHRFDPSVTHDWVAQALGVGPCVQRRAAPVCGPACAPVCGK
jgi:hypothetical protein